MFWPYAAITNTDISGFGNGSLASTFYASNYQAKARNENTLGYDILQNCFKTTVALFNPFQVNLEGPQQVAMLNYYLFTSFYEIKYGTAKDTTFAMASQIPVITISSVLAFTDVTNDWYRMAVVILFRVYDSVQNLIDMIENQNIDLHNNPFTSHMLANFAERNLAEKDATNESKDDDDDDDDDVDKISEDLWNESKDDDDDDDDDIDKISEDLWVGNCFDCPVDYWTKKTL
eukprot:Awhi_evm1s9543